MNPYICHLLSLSDFKSYKMTKFFFYARLGKKTKFISEKDLQMCQSFDTLIAMMQRSDLAHEGQNWHFSSLSQLPETFGPTDFTLHKKKIMKLNRHINFSAGVSLMNSKSLSHCKQKTVHVKHQAVLMVPHETIVIITIEFFVLL